MKTHNTSLQNFPIAIRTGGGETLLPQAHAAASADRSADRSHTPELAASSSKKATFTLDTLPPFTEEKSVEGEGINPLLPEGRTSPSHRMQDRTSHQPFWISGVGLRAFCDGHRNGKTRLARERRLRVQKARTTNGKRM